MTHHDRTGPSLSLRLLVLCFFFGSGMTGLVYQVLWTRMLESVIGSSPAAVTIVLTVFMAGLGIGSFLAGQLSSRLVGGRLLTVYGILEVCIGFYGLLLPVLLTISKPLFALFYTRLFDSPAAYHALTFTSCALLLIIPTICMGATLPVLTGYLVTRYGSLGGQSGRLYAVNTLGAAAGAMLTGFVLIAVLGVRATLYSAVAANILIGLGSILIARRSVVLSAESNDEPAPSEQSIPDSLHLVSSRQIKAALILFAVAGFCGMSFEVIWTRLLGLIAGPTTYSFTIVISTFIFGIAIGSALFGYIADRVKDRFMLLILTQVLMAITAIWISHLLGNSQIFFAKLIATLQSRFLALETVKALILMGLLFVPTMLSGAAFPLVMRLITASVRSVGTSAGVAVAANTVGAVLGSFAAGYLLIPLLGKEGGIRFTAGLQLIMATGLGAMYAFSQHHRLRRWLPVGLLAAYGLIILTLYPNWDRFLLSIGKYHRFDEITGTETGWFDTFFFGTDIYEGFHSGDLVFYGDGPGGFTTVKRDSTITGEVTYCLFNSGKPDASTASGDMSTQTMLAHVPLLLHPAPDRVMVLGLASGITAGEALHYPVASLDVVDINPQVVAASDFFRDWNSDALDDPRTGLILQDGRAHLDLTNRFYDVIISEPSNPWMAGLASLFTEEFFRMAHDRLVPGGIFVQWLHAYQIDWESYAMVGRTFAEVFPESVLFNIDPSGAASDYLLVGFREAVSIDWRIIETNLEYAQRSDLVNLLSPGVLARLLVADNLQAVFGPGETHTDNHPRLEYRAPQHMHTYDIAILENIGEHAGLTPELATVKMDAMQSMDEQIAFAAYVLSFDQPLFSVLDISGATPAQRDRYRDHLIRFCTDRYVTSFGFIEDEDIRADCIRAQIASMDRKAGEAPDPAELTYHIANLHLLLGEYDEAIEWFRITARSDPEHYLSRYNAGRVFAMTDRHEQAMAAYRDAINSNPEHALSHNHLANELVRFSRFEEAISSYREAIRLDPGLALAHRNLGLVLERMGNTDEAAFHLGEADRIEDNSE